MRPTPPNPQPWIEEIEKLLGFGDRCEQEALRKDRGERRKIIAAPEFIFTLDSPNSEQVRLAYFGLHESPRQIKARSTRREKQWLGNRNWQDLQLLSRSRVETLLTEQRKKKGDTKKLIRSGLVWRHESIRLEARANTWLHAKAPPSALPMIFQHEGFGWRAEWILSEMANYKLGMPRTDEGSRGDMLWTKLGNILDEADFYAMHCAAGAPAFIAENLAMSVKRLQRLQDGAYSLSTEECIRATMEMTNMLRDLRTLADCEWMRDNLRAAKQVRGHEKNKGVEWMRDKCLEFYTIHKRMPSPSEFIQQHDGKEDKKRLRGKWVKVVLFDHAGMDVASKQITKLALLKRLNKICVDITGQSRQRPGRPKKRTLQQL